MNTKKRIGILTSGGDCAGLNAVISSVVEAATQKGITFRTLPGPVSAVLTLVL